MDPLEILSVFVCNLGGTIVSLWLVSAIGPLRGLATVLARRVAEDLQRPRDS